MIEEQKESKAENSRRMKLEADKNDESIKIKDTKMYDDQNRKKNNQRITINQNFRENFMTNSYKTHL